MSSELKTIILVVAFAKCLVCLLLFLGLGIFARNCLRTNSSILIFTSLTFLELIMLFLSTSLMIFWLKVPAQRLLRLVSLISTINLFLFGLLMFAGLFYILILLGKILLDDREEDEDFNEERTDEKNFKLAIRLIPVVIFLSALLSVLDMVVLMQISTDISPHVFISFFWFNTRSLWNKFLYLGSLSFLRAK